MLRRIGWFVSLNQRLLAAKRSQNVEQPGTPARPIQKQLNAAHEIAIYIHRFHNLDLFEEGWYKIKITMRWEDGEDSYPGIPARVVQYEAPEVGANSSSRVWMIDDTDHSFSTPPFQITYARQDVFLSIMISFYVSFRGYEEKTSAVILKFELVHSPTPEFRTGLLDSCGSVHEYRIPPKALLGSHSYCPVYFDSFHAVLVDTSVHITLLKPSYRTTRQKFNYSSASQTSEDTYDEDYVRSNTVVLIKSMMAAHDFLLEDLRRISKGINQDIDLNGITLKQDIVEGKLSPQSSMKPKVEAEKADNDTSRLNEESIQHFSWDDMLNSFQSMGSQLLNIWNAFLSFHRENKTKILEFLFNSWANDRKTECSIWMVYSKVEMPHQYMNNDVEGTSRFYGLLRRSLSTRRLSDDPVQTSIMRAELHRQGIAQMRINSRSLQDMFMFGDPSQVPIVIVERLANITRSVSVNSYLTPLDVENGSTTCELSQSNLSQNEDVLRVVVFVHGFQGHHLDLRLVRNQWVIIDPKVKFLMSEANEDNTSGDIREMGSRLAKEVDKYLKKKIIKASRSGRLKDIHLSFVGHSMGNLIIRTALTESIMEPYTRYLYTYVSMSGPHLGYMYSSNPIFNSGLWLLKKMTDMQCMHQLTFSDDNDLENTFIYNLSKKMTLINFRNVILLASPQDGYVPYHSARIESCPGASLDSSKQGKVFLQMLNNCLDQLRTHSDHRVVMRFDINFDTSSYGRNLNSFLGRAAHIDFLERDIFIKFIMWSFPEIFS
ncbi:hypothetical protein HN51_030690 [Arachis hypogaea]|uniref:uncharacterized protein n=1 Tax=Arachis hypogaea TaxID=3818 RepID=UPI000DEC870B|nr:protein FAM135B [Arachis hypogaea]QHO15224.1 uncharacterized protein DS421_10g293070 [Arachis hypogaea]